MRDEGEDYAARLMEASVPCALARYSGMIHGFFSMSEMVDDGMKAIEHAASLVKTALER